MPEPEKLGWPLLHSKLPPAAIHPLRKDVYGVEGLSDVNEAYLIQRLFASGLRWEWRLGDQTYLGAEDRQVRDKDYTTRYYLASVKGELVIDGRAFHGSGASDNRKIDAAFKGAATVAFKNAAKIAGLTIELFKDGRAMDFIYEDRQGNVVGVGASQGPTDEVNGSTTASSVAVNQPAPAPSVEVPPGLVRSTGADERPTASGTNDAVAETPPPPQTAAVMPLSGPAFSRRMGVGRSVGPAPKRTNVVTPEPQASEKPATVPEGAQQQVAPPEAIPAQPAPPDLVEEPVAAAPAEDGLAPQRQLLRQAAAELAHVNAILFNKVTAPLENKALVPVPPTTPSDLSDEGLARLVDRDFPGRTVANLDAAGLQNRLELVESNLAKKKALMAERGITAE